MIERLRTSKGMAYLRAWRLTPKLIRGAWQARGQPKVFCVGANKTGTTSLRAAWREMGLVVGEQRIAELLVHSWGRGGYGWLIRYCHTAQAFQDAPFSWPGTYGILDQAFPGSRFVLTVRDSAEQWYTSLTSYHAALWGQGHIPTAADLQRATYVYRGYAYEANRILGTTPDDDLYNRDLLLARYRNHNQEVQRHFRDRPNDLLVLNVAEPDAYDRLCDFLGYPRPGKPFPWENRTTDWEQGGAR